MRVIQHNGDSESVDATNIILMPALSIAVASVILVLSLSCRLLECMRTKLLFHVFNWPFIDINWFIHIKFEAQNESVFDNKNVDFAKTVKIYCYQVDYFLLSPIKIKNATNEISIQFKIYIYSLKVCFLFVKIFFRINYVYALET